MSAKRKKAASKILTELSDVYKKDSSELDHSNEDKIAAPQHIASRDQPLESDSANENLVQQMKEAAKYYLKDEEAGAAFMKRAFELYYSNEDEIAAPRHFASLDRSLESDSNVTANFRQQLKDVADIYFDDEKDGIAFLLANFLDNEESQEWIQSDSDASPAGMEIVRDAEALVMSEIEPKVEVFDVPITDEVVIHTVCFKSDPQGSKSHKVPLVMVHGFGGGNPAFHKIYGQLSKDRCVYGIDLPGFALSSRVKFSDDATSCENKMVELIESWRNKMDLDAIILLGHSFGGYISAAYALKHYKHVHHLLLLDPWGVLSQKEDDNQQSKRIFEEILKKFFATFHLNPFQAVQGLGFTIGGHLIKMVMNKVDREDYGQNCTNYFVQAIMRGRPTGANAFSVLSDHTFVYPKAPLKRRLIQLLQRESVDLPITFIYGKKSTLQNKGGQDIKKACEGKRVNIEGIEEGTHHIQVQKPEEIMKIIQNYAFTDDIQLQKTDEASKIVCDCPTSCDVPLPQAKKWRKSATNSANKHEKSDNWYFARHVLFVLVVVIIAIVYARLYM